MFLWAMSQVGPQLTVTGAGSQLTTGSLSVGTAGTGVVNISDGATVSATRVILGTPAGFSTGTLNISNATLVSRGFGISIQNTRGRSITDNATILVTTNTAGLTSGTAAQNNIAAGGLTINTAAPTVLASVGFSGVGGLTKTGTGLLQVCRRRQQLHRRHGDRARHLPAVGCRRLRQCARQFEPRGR